MAPTVYVGAVTRMRRQHLQQTTTAHSSEEPVDLDLDKILDNLAASEQSVVRSEHETTALNRLH